MVMVKKQWEQPKAFVQAFEPTEYVAACGDTEYGKYLFTCDAPGGTLYYYKTAWWGGEEAERLGSYTPCDEKHEADKAGEFPRGFVDYNNNRKEDEGEAVIVWIERNWWGGIENAHATTNLKQDSWETVKS